MDTLLEILRGIDCEIDFEHERGLITERLLDSFGLIMIVPFSSGTPSSLSACAPEIPLGHVIRRQLWLFLSDLRMAYAISG